MTLINSSMEKLATFRSSWNIKPIGRLKRWTSISMPRWGNEGSK
jgi:hypothetical protein